MKSVLTNPPVTLSPVETNISTSRPDEGPVSVLWDVELKAVGQSGCYSLNVWTIQQSINGTQFAIFCSALKDQIRVHCGKVIKPFIKQRPFWKDRTSTPGLDLRKCISQLLMNGQLHKVRVLSSTDFIPEYNSSAGLQMCLRVLKVIPRVLL